MTESQFETILVDYDPAMQQLAREVRALIFDVLPQTVEVVWTQQKTVGYGTGPKKMTEHFSWIAPAKKHIVLQTEVTTGRPVRDAARDCQCRNRPNIPDAVRRKLTSTSQ
jgi:hypothetical protein